MQATPASLQGSEELFAVTQVSITVSKVSITGTKVSITATKLLITGSKLLITAPHGSIAVSKVATQGRLVLFAVPFVVVEGTLEIDEGSVVLA